MKFVNKGINYITLSFFAPVLILTGVFGFILPEGLMSNAPAYNIFHLIFGLIGLALVLLNKQKLIPLFNIIPHGKWFAKKLRKPARSKGAKTAHLLRAFFAEARTK
jgi:hypothetical protein